MKVVKMDMTQPFCVTRNVNVCLDMSVTFVKTNVKNIYLHLGCPHYDWPLKTKNWLLHDW